MSSTYMQGTRYFVYRLLDNDHEAVYIGRSCNVANRIKSHAKRAEWFHDVRDVTMTGPFTWAEARDLERREIERYQPRGNQQFTLAYGWRPRAPIPESITTGRKRKSA